RAKQQHLRRRRRDAKRLGELIAGEAIRLAQDERGALAGSQLGEDAAHRVAHGEAPRGIAGRGINAPVERERAAHRRLAPAQVIEREVRRHAQQPGLWAVVEADALKLPPGAQKCLLAKIVRPLFLAGHAPEVGEDGAVARLEKRLEALTLPRKWIIE